MRRLIFLLAVALAATAADRTRYNFNPGWKVLVGDPAGAEAAGFDDSRWKMVALPYAWNQEPVFHAAELPVGIAWYRKHFKLPAGAAAQKIFLEFEGIRDNGDFYLNGKRIGRHENGFTAFGWDITAAVRPAPIENVLAVRVANLKPGYAGIPNVWLYATSRLHQTLPLYSTLGTTGVYVYARDFDFAGQSARITAEAQVKNEFDAPRTFTYEAVIRDVEGRTVATLDGGSHTMKAGQTALVTASEVVNKLHFWSWGYGYLYEVSTVLRVNGQPVDTVVTRTGFRKTEFSSGMVKLNDRAIQLKGYVRPLDDAWPLVGPSFPPWLSDFSNRAIVEGNGNLVRWTPSMPSKQDIESCDRVGLMETLPAGDAGSDAGGRQWEQRVELMRDAMVYDRNNPSIVFYEAGTAVPEDHMREIRELRDRYDARGGRAAGAAGMPDSKQAEYGGETGVLDKSAGKPLWTMAYAAEEAIAAIGSWYQFWTERPGTGARVNAGGVAVMDAGPMRIPGDSYFANQVMWDGWVDSERPLLRILGRWTYTPGTKRDVFVVSNQERVELRLNNKSLGDAERSRHFLFTFRNVDWQPGTLQAMAYDASGRRTAMARLDSTGPPAYVSLSVRTGHNGMMADAADLAMVDVEVMDGNGRRCPAAEIQVHLSTAGPAELLGEADVRVEDGIRRVFLRATHQPGRIVLQANSPGLQLGVIDFISRPATAAAGLSTEPLGLDLMPYLGRGPTPGGESYKTSRVPVHIVSATAASNGREAEKSYDDDEATQWQSRGEAGMAWIEYRFDEAATPSQVVMKLADSPTPNVPIRISVDGAEVFAGETPKSLGYVTLPLKPAAGRSLRIERTTPGPFGVVEVEIYR